MNYENKIETKENIINKILGEAYVIPYSACLRELLVKLGVESHLYDPVLLPNIWHYPHGCQLVQGYLLLLLGLLVYQVGQAPQQHVLPLLRACLFD